MDPFGYANQFGADMRYGVRRGIEAREFKSVYRCYPINMLRGNERNSSNYGGKIFLPQSALAKLSELHIEYPMLFALNKNNETRTTHAGVLEFIAEEGRMYAPDWMMRALAVQMGELVNVVSTSLPLGKFVKIQPQSVDFLDITDPKAVLEQAFRSFSTLTQGDIISIHYNNKLYDILIMETKPAGAGISIIETDLEVDFAAPVGYIEPEPQRRAPAPQNASSIAEHVVKQEEGFHAFKGSGQRLNGRSEMSGSSYGGASGSRSGAHANASSASSSMTTAASAVARAATTAASASASLPGDANNNGVPDALILPFGKLFFGYPVVPLKKAETEGETTVSENGAGASSSFSGILGSGNTLRAARKSGVSKPSSLAGSGVDSLGIPDSPAPSSSRSYDMFGGDSSSGSSSRR